MGAAAPTLTWEQYQQLPPEQRRRPLTPAEYAALTPSQLEAAGLAEASEGAPADFGGPVFPNPNHVTPQLDTDNAIPVTRTPNGVTFQRGNYQGGAQSDISNPAAAEVIPPALRTVGANMSAQPSSPPQTLPADFQQWDKAPATLPADFNQWDQPKGAPVSQPSALSRLGTNFLSAIGVGSNDDAKNFFEHPIQTAMNSLNAQGELAKKAKDAYDRGDYKSAVIHGLNYLVPFIGQQTDKAGEQIAQGDYAGAVGRTLGAAAPIIAGSPEVQAGASDATSAAGAAIKPIVAKTARVASDIVDPDLTGVVSPRLAYAQKAAGRLADVLEKTNNKAAPAALDATAENKPFAGGADEPPPQKVLDATGENKPFAGGMDEPLLPKRPVQRAAAPVQNRTVVTDPQTGQPEFSDVVAQKQQAAQITPQPKAAPAKAAAPETAAATSDPLLDRLRNIAAKNENEPRVPAPDEDLTALGQQSLDMIRARKGGVMTTANPADLAKRWGVDTESLQSGREQTRGMSPEQTELYVNQLAESYKNGRPVEPVMETRDEGNNVIDADGRARVLAAQRAGIERVPIMIRRIAKGPPLPTLEPEKAGSSGQ